MNKKREEILSLTHLITPTSLGMDGSLLKIASQRRTRRNEAEKLHVILDAIFPPIAPTAGQVPEQYCGTRPSLHQKAHTPYVRI